MIKKSSVPRLFLCINSILIPFIFLYCNRTDQFKNNVSDMLVYVGTYTTGESEGIYIYKLRLTSGELVYYGKATGIVDPSFLVIHPSKKFLYSVENERGSQGNICAFSINQETGELTFINKQSAEGTGPCHVSVDRSGKYVLVANYSGGNVSMLPINADGSLRAASDIKQHVGSSVNQERQNEPHPHSIWVSPDNRFAFVPDLGIDKLVAYKLDLLNGKLIPNTIPDFQTAPGAGPRHFTFHPKADYAFVINEINSTITSLRYHSQDGSFDKIQTVTTLPDDFSGSNSCADIHITPNGKFIYGSNRGHNSMVVLSFDEKAEKMNLIELESVQGDWPRNFALDPTGNILLVANQLSSNVVTYWINQDTGELTPTGYQVQIPNPVCLKLMDLP